MFEFRGVGGKQLKSTGTSCNKVLMRFSTKSTKMLGWFSGHLTWVAFLLGSYEAVGRLPSNFA
jgi:hypothetical protein